MARVRSVRPHPADERENNELHRNRMVPCASARPMRDHCLLDRSNRPPVREVRNMTGGSVVLTHHRKLEGGRQEVKQLRGRYL